MPRSGRGAAAPHKKLSKQQTRNYPGSERTPGGISPPANLVNSNAVRSVRRRGNVNNGANYGPRYVNANNAPSNANWNYGAALYPCQSKPQRFVSYTGVFPFRGPARDQNTIRLDRPGRCSISKALTLPASGYGSRRDEKHETCRKSVDNLLLHRDGNRSHISGYRK